MNGTAPRVARGDCLGWAWGYWHWQRCTAKRATSTAAAKISAITASSATSNGTGAIFAKNANRFRLPRKYAAKAASAAVRQEERKATSRTGIGAIQAAGQNSPSPMET